MVASSLPAAARPTRALLGIACALGGGALLSVNDAAVKALSGEHALHLVVLIRSLIGLAVVLSLLVASNGLRGALRALGTRRPGMHGLRAACVVLSNGTYFLGLAALPLADGVAIFFVAPLLVAALSRPLLGERVAPGAWTAVAVGLGGVVVMMRPSWGAVQPAAVLVAASALFYALAQTLARRMAATEGALTMNAWAQAAFVATCCGVGLAVGDGRFAGGADPSLAFLFRPWAWPAAGDWPFLVATGLATSLGGTLLAQAYRTCPPALVAPFEYVALPLAVVWGVLVFGTWPDLLSWTGIALIAGAGLATLWREARRREEP